MEYMKNANVSVRDEKDDVKVRLTLCQSHQMKRKFCDSVKLTLKLCHCQYRADEKRI